MTAPNPLLRISPSGPLTTGETDPLIEYAGIALQAENSTVPAAEAIASIGALGAIGAFANPLVLPMVPGPTTVAGTPRGKFSVIGGAAGFSFGAGEWIVEGVIQVGYATDGPTSGSNSGGLRVTAQIVGDDNLVKTAAASPIFFGPRSGPDSAPSFVASRAQPFGVSVFISQAQVNANGGPFTGLQLTLERATGTSPELVYDANSGLLEIQNGSRVTVRRYR